MFGANNIIGSAVSIDLAEHKMLKNVYNANSRLSSII